MSLLSPSIMRFKEEHGESIIDAFLPQRSFYVMTYGSTSLFPFALFSRELTVLN